MNTQDELTKQEKIVLAFVARGWRTAKIAQELCLSPRTVETHLRHIYEKLAVSSRIEAAMYVLRASLLEDREVRRNPDDVLSNTSRDTELGESVR